MSETLDIPKLSPAMKHPAVFARFDALHEGEAFIIINDHDPKPLYYQMVAERGKQFTWTYLKNGPMEWQVEIRKNPMGITVGELVAEDIRRADVFKKFGIDFCCGGKKTLEQACREKGIDKQLVESALYNVGDGRKAPVLPFNRWEPGFLVDYIYNQHHLYYYEEAPIIAELLDKVAFKHGEHFPELYKIQSFYKQLQQELAAHFLKEERVLFPVIKTLSAAERSKEGWLPTDLPSVKEPVFAMEADHDAAGEILEKIREATHNFQPPQGSCNSFKLLYLKLQDLEADLHQHVHLENNILFPKALALEKQHCHPD